MKNAFMNISASVHSLSLERKSVIRGWYLLVTPEGEEYVMRRHLGLSSRRYWELYRSSISLEDCILNTDKERKKHVSATFFGIVGGAIVTRLIPSEYLLGSSNTPFSWMQALYNVSVLLLTVIVFVMLLSKFRDFRFKQFITRKGGKLERIGDVRGATPLRYMPSGKGYW
ncbi:hypothetical protein HO419_10850 [Streptococcus suis]|uniref:hypothetical protein n=1 Tax=Streptococcus suis TaxID=1307 RepID=UPI0004625812|nr:hypothetical protein [Streptococcus suis]MBM7137033.1 hypothetical protein [Streptococcus suis]MBO4110100.1 hypothetical protein [Streptococcus suis]MBY4601147.1 hypothetical protein [Streptococcus suis]MCO8172449.1 hypothetical protein [Streptococcus suis]MCO8180832.1 hypothetical protein [Streptococcus suis]